MNIKISRKKIIIGACILAVVLICIVLLIIKGTQGSSNDKNVEYENCKVKSSKMVKTLTAAGEITSADSDNIDFSTSKTFLAMCVEENEMVSKGQNLILYSDGTYEKAPARGVVLSINAPETGTVAGSQNLIEFGKTGRLSVELTVPEDQINEVSVGDKAKVVAGSDLSKEFSGRITEKRAMSTTLISEKSSDSQAGASGGAAGVSGGGTNAKGGSSMGGSDPFGSESSTAYYTVIVEFKNNGKLKPGMSASCTVTISSRKGVTTVPVEAVYFDDNEKAYVNLVNGSKTEKQTVKTGESDAENVEIKKGLEVGDTVQVEKQAGSK